MQPVESTHNARRRASLFSWLTISAALLLACGGATDPGGSAGNAGSGVALFATISGLQGSGLILQNNGAGDFPVPAGGDRAFWQNIAKQSSYAVTVKAQPTDPWQTCTVTNGAGTANADVNDIAVVCTTNRYAVRGSISGLTATGLALALNGGGTQPIAVGAATFSFPGVASGTQYTVTSASQPAGQTCVIGNGSGRMAGADITGLSVTCGAPGFTVGGDAGVGADGLTLRLNGGTPMPLNPDALSFTFPTVLRTGASWNAVVVDEPTAPRMTCTLVRARGRIVAANATASQVMCFGNNNLVGYEGTYAVTVNGRKQYLTVWLDGSITVVTRLDDATCPNAGNGIEFGVYRHPADNTFLFRVAREDTNGGCGLSDPALPPGGNPPGTMQRSNDTLMLNTPTGQFTLTAVESVPGSLVGAWTRTDGFDGSVIVFESDGTYLYADPQGTPTMNARPGYERGCYVISGATFTTSLGASCTPNGFSALDGNGGGGGFSAKNGAAIPFTITGPNAVTIDGVPYRRLLPAG